MITTGKADHICKRTPCRNAISIGGLHGIPHAVISRIKRRIRDVIIPGRFRGKDRGIQFSDLAAGRRNIIPLLLHFVLQTL
ncbi:hypothetical protein CRN65_27275 (plasmid) [Klebsiella pneumoniae]|nr:hypothetical protein CRN65_27275 [Klebsiella pneumoniae]